MLTVFLTKSASLILAIIAPIIIFVLLSGLFMLFITFKISHTLYKMQWTRAKNIEHERKCSDPTVDYHLDMYNQGLAWRENYLKNKIDVEINRENMNFYGEYFDFGKKKTVIILPGRTECAHYSAYYAEPFRVAGYNVLTVDQRTNGKSDGDKITLGKEEHLDLKAWGELLHDSYKQDTIVTYGICSGATTALILYTSEYKPSYFKALITDGMYFTFRDLYKNHLIERKKPVFPILDEVIWLIKHCSKVDPKEIAPKKFITKLSDDILILHGIYDAYTSVENAKELYNLCASKNKTLVLLSARHSHLRYDDKSKFDDAVINFLARY